MGLYFSAKRKKADLGQRLRKGKWRRNEHLQMLTKGQYGEGTLHESLHLVLTLSLNTKHETDINRFSSQKYKEAMCKLRDPTV